VIRVQIINIWEVIWMVEGSLLKLEGCSLSTCKSVEERKNEETHVRACSPHLARLGPAGGA
jgi:hypothetical protein